MPSDFGGFAPAPPPKPRKRRRTEAKIEVPEAKRPRLDPDLGNAMRSIFSSPVPAEAKRSSSNNSISGQMNQLAINSPTASNPPAPLSAPAPASSGHPVVPAQPIDGAPMDQSEDKRICSACMEEIKAADRVMTPAGKCQHLLHENCALRMVLARTTEHHHYALCPVCRSLYWINRDYLNHAIRVDPAMIETMMNPIQTTHMLSLGDDLNDGFFWVAPRRGDTINVLVYIERWMNGNSKVEVIHRINPPFPFPAPPSGRQARFRVSAQIPATILDLS